MKEMLAIQIEDLIGKNNMEGIENSRMFFVLGTHTYFYGTDESEALRIKAMVAYAKLLGKPFRVALEKGVELPDCFLDDVSDYKIEEFTKDDVESIKECSLKLLKEDLKEK